MKITSMFAVAALVVPAFYCFSQETETIEIPETEAVTEVVSETAAEITEAVAEVAEAAAEVAEVAEAAAEVAEAAEEVIFEVAEAAEEVIFEEVIIDDDDSVLFFAVNFDVASATLNDDGSKLTKNAVFIPEIKAEAVICESTSLTLGLWANYDLSEGRSNYAKRDSCLTEIDLSAGLSFNFSENFNMSGEFRSYQYFNLDWKTDNLLAFDVNTKCSGLELGLQYEYMTSGDAKKNMAIMPYAQYGIMLCEKSALSVDFGMKPVFVVVDDGGSAWTACVIGAKVNMGQFYVYGKYYAQMCDSLYTDAMHKDVNAVFGAGYGIKF